MLARVYRGLDVDGAKVGRGGQQHHVHAAGDDFLVGIKADEAASLRHINLVSDFLLLAERLETQVQPVAEGIAHRDELDVGVGGQGLGRRTGAASTAADETDAE